MEFQREVTDRQRVRLILADLLQANSDYERARRQHEQASGPDSLVRLAGAKAAVLRLQAEARRVVERVGYHRDRERLAKLMDVPV
jgi:hypothetical protein